MGILTSELLEELRHFDGRALTVPGEIAARHKDRPGYLDGLIACAIEDEPHISSGATWLIKHHFEDGGNLSGKQTEKWIETFSGLPDWQAQLHFCQTLQYPNLGNIDCSRLVLFLEDLTGHKRPFLRAWAVDGLCRVAMAQEAYRATADQSVDQAMKDSAASVRARARILSKLLVGAGSA